MSSFFFSNEESEWEWLVVSATKDDLRHYWNLDFCSYQLSFCDGDQSNLVLFGKIGKVCDYQDASHGSGD